MLSGVPSATAGLLCYSGKPFYMKMIAEPPGFTLTPREAQLLETTETGEERDSSTFGENNQMVSGSLSWCCVKAHRASETKDYRVPIPEVLAPPQPQDARSARSASSPRASASSSKSSHLLPGPWAPNLLPKPVAEGLSPPTPLLTTPKASSSWTLIICFHCPSKHGDFSGFHRLSLFLKR